MIMHNNESPLVFLSIVYLVVLYIVSLIRSPRFTDVTKQNAYYDKRGRPTYLKFLAIVLVVVTVVSYMVTRSAVAVLEAGILDIPLSALLGVNLFLLRFNKAKDKSKNRT
jgi:Ca2+/Na+ antiporter